MVPRCSRGYRTAEAAAAGQLRRGSAVRCASLMFVAAAVLLAALLLLSSVALLLRLVAALSWLLLMGLVLTAVVVAVVDGFFSYACLFCLGFVRMPFFCVSPPPPSKQNSRVMIV